MIDDRLRSAFDDVRRLDPDPADKFGAVVQRAERRAVAQRAFVGAAAVLLLVVGAAAVVIAADDGDGKTIAATDGATPETVPPDETTTSTTGLLGLAPIKVPSTLLPAPSTTAKPPPTSTSSTPPTTSTTVAPPASGPHTGYASVKGVEVQASQGSYCWKGGEGQAALCADKTDAWGDRAPVLEASTQDILTWRWATKEQPKSLSAYVFAYAGGRVVWTTSKQVECAGGNPCRIALDLGPGDYFVMVGSYWSQGSTEDGVRLHVSG